MFTSRDAEVSRLRAIAAGRLDAVEWSTTEDGRHRTGFPSLGVALPRCVWDGTPERRIEHGGMVAQAGRGVWVDRDADPYAALAALARLALDVGGVPARPVGGPAPRVVREAGHPAAAGAAHDGRPALRPAG